MKLLYYFGYDVHFESDSSDSVDYVDAKVFLLSKIKKTVPQLHLFKCYLKTRFEVHKYDAKWIMFHEKIVTDWDFLSNR